MFSSTFAIFSLFVNLSMAKDEAELHKPSNSAPVKFLVKDANSSKSMSLPSMSLSFIFLVWINKMSLRPFSSGNEISIWISKRPGRNNALSIKSNLFVIPMIKILFNCSTPSIFAKSWLTTLSPTPVPSLSSPPLCLKTESNSSNIIMCNWEFSPFALYSASASLNKFSMFSSEDPTYLESISGPFTIFGSLTFNILPICLAIKVLPVPGGPNNKRPLT
ncbi:hypothetical protein CLUG_03595 [Clavispora lusitaniae ATCC 42720]|uniref:Uncharacterized protein n=1 Tax=Clavispora lusitaniae (strain ATCC 42720) TaxID=306902 RepID=C4Y611_CLAL4|nr:uncharacterized protein CLUG_03595 [Clavispora lusitaniae ATCC 42720]EEQ39466.1 hypothetical protein CLUG_03595 [Clavispora lusitaniae ATCC 42720]